MPRICWESERAMASDWLIAKYPAPPRAGFPEVSPGRKEKTSKVFDAVWECAWQEVGDLRSQGDVRQQPGRSGNRR